MVDVEMGIFLSPRSSRPSITFTQPSSRQYRSWILPLQAGLALTALPEARTTVAVDPRCPQRLQHPRQAQGADEPLGEIERQQQRGAHRSSLVETAAARGLRCDR